MDLYQVQVGQSQSRSNKTGKIWQNAKKKCQRQRYRQGLAHFTLHLQLLNPRTSRTIFASAPDSRFQIRQIRSLNKFQFIVPSLPAPQIYPPSSTLRSTQSLFAQLSFRHTALFVPQSLTTFGNILSLPFERVEKKLTTHETMTMANIDHTMRDEVVESPRKRSRGKNG